MFTRGFVIHHLNDWNNLPIMERWFHREHAADVLNNAPLLKYDMYRAVNPPPKGAEAFCFMNYRIHETLSFRDADNMNMNGKPSMRAEPVENAMNVAMFNVPEKPDHDVWGAQRRAFETPVIRWMTVFKFPDGVDKAEAESWYFNVHMPELIEKAGDKIVRCFSYGVYPNFMNAASMHQAGSKNEKNFHLPFSGFSPLMFVSWDRMTELWFRSGAEWTHFIEDIAPSLTKPEWASQDMYPWVIPGKEFCSTFLLERATENLMKTTEIINYG